MKSRNIGLLRLSAFGDVVLCVPVVRTLQHCFPQDKITWITSPSSYEILKGLSGVEFIVIDKPSNPVDYWKIYRQLKPYRFDILLAMQASFRANLFYPLLSAGRKVGFDKMRARDGHHCFIHEAIPSAKEHLLDGFMRFAEAAGCCEKLYRWDLDISDEDEAWVKQNLPLSFQGKKILAINPSASKRERNWLTERYVEVIRQAKKRWSIEVVLTGGPSEEEKKLAEAIMGQLDPPILNWVGKTTPKQLAAVLRGVDVLLSPDTGPLHLAGAVGTPVIGLYAVAPSTLSGPYFSRDLTIDKFPEAVKTILKKDPDNIPWGTRVHSQEAMALITVDDVIRKLGKFFTLVPKN